MGRLCFLHFFLCIVCGSRWIWDWYLVPICVKIKIIIRVIIDFVSFYLFIIIFVIIMYHFFWSFVSCTFKIKIYQSNTGFKKKPKLMLKTVVDDYVFNFKLKAVVTNYGFDGGALVWAFFSNLYYIGVFLFHKIIEGLN